LRRGGEEERRRGGEEERRRGEEERRFNTSTSKCLLFQQLNAQLLNS